VRRRQGPGHAASRTCATAAEHAQHELLRVQTEFEDTRTLEARNAASIAALLREHARCQPTQSGLIELLSVGNSPISTTNVCHITQHGSVFFL
jgi:hypothetical protein